MLTNLTWEIIVRVDHRPRRFARVFVIAIVTVTIGGMRQLRVDAYVMDTLMPDLVMHDRQPSAFLVYLHLWHRSTWPKASRQSSHQSMADATGLSKSAVQAAIRTLSRRKLVRARRASATAAPEYTVLRPWRR